MTVVWRDKAIADLERIDAWLSGIEGANSTTVRRRIDATAEALQRLGDIGRPSKISGLREISVRNAQYVIVYHTQNELTEIVAVFHTAEDR